MTEPVIPYATLERRGLRGQDLFGVVVRSAGLLMVLWGFYTLVYLLNVRAVSAPSAAT